MKKTSKLLCFLLSALLILPCLPAMSVSAAIGTNGFYCDFDDIPVREVGAAALDNSYFMSEGLAFADTIGGIAVEDRAGDGNKGLHLYSSASVGAALPMVVTSGKVKVTLSIYPSARATYVYLASSMGSSLATSTYVTIGKFGDNFTLGTSGSSVAMTQNRYNRIELIADLASKTLTGYCNGKLIGTLADLNITTVKGVIVGGNAIPEHQTTNKPLIGDLGISTYTENNTFSCVSAEDTVDDGVHTTTIMFDEPVNADTLPKASNVTIEPTVGGQAYTASAIRAYGPVVTLTWRGEMSAGTEYRIDFGSGLKSDYNRPLDDGAYLTGPLSKSTMTLIDEDFDDLTTQNLDVTTGFNAVTAIYLLGGDSHVVQSDVNQAASDAGALCFNKSNDGTYDEPRYLKMPHSDSAWPYVADDPYTASDGNYAAVPYQNSNATYSQGLYYRLGDLTKTELGTMPDSGIITWSFDYLWEQGSGSAVSSVSLTWSGEGRNAFGANLIGMSQKANDTNQWNSVVVEYNASEHKVRYGASADALGGWIDMDMSTCDWLVIPVNTSVQRLSFAVDNVKVTWTNTPLYVEGVRYVALDGTMTGSSSIQAETEKIKIYFSAPVANDIANHVTIDGSTVSSYELSADKKIMTVSTGLFKGGSSVTLAIDADAASAAGNKIAQAKSYTLTIGSGCFALNNLNVDVVADSAGVISIGDKVTVNADVINTIADAQSYTFVAAYYNGRSLVELRYQPCSLTSSEYFKKESYDFIPTATGKAYDTVKVFAWNSITEHWALVEAVSY
ncbi:MAG: hypothetical protein IKV73_08595 [Clostridia bacterium]|nr:hypothetical protein [Clostridia bacterium]